MPNISSSRTSTSSRQRQISRLAAEGGGNRANEPEIALGPLKAALSYRQEGSGEEATTIPIVTVFADGKQVAELKGEGTGTGDPPVSVQIAEIDPANSSPEVVVSFYTGGAHCCSDTKVISASKDGASWKTIELGQFDGGPLLASDLAGDGHPVFETRDNAFLYTFGCYACSTAPLKILTIEDGEVKNVSADPRFRASARVLSQEHDHGGAGRGGERLSRRLCGREDPARRGQRAPGR